MKEIVYPIEIDVDDLQFRFITAMAVAGLSIRDVADYMGRPVSRVHHAVWGQKSVVDLDFLINFCAICHCSIADILPFCNDVLPFPYTFAAPGGGLVSDIAPDPYRIGFKDPESLVSREWEKRSKIE